MQRLSMAGVSLYALFLLIVPFTHHDLACHLKTPQHCTSCASSPAGSQAGVPIAPDTFQLADAGRLVTLHSPATSPLLTPRTTGRSPPRSA